MCSSCCLLKIKSFFNKNKEEITPVVLESFLAKHLRPHQKVGVTFLYECVSGFKAHEYFGAILADEMGLGKTIQTICLIWYVYISMKIFYFFCFCFLF